jgi:hypothetical protein
MVASPQTVNSCPFKTADPAHGRPDKKLR